MGSTSSAPSSPRQVIGHNGETRTISERTALRVWVAAGGRCTMCNRRLVDDAHTGADVSVGQLAHIVGWSKASGSPRGGDELPVDERNDEANLMLLCYDQHRVIDNRSMWDVFDVDMLRGMKRRHEQRIAQLTAIADDDKTTVLRVIGCIRGASVSASPQTRGLCSPTAGSPTMPCSASTSWRSTCARSRARIRPDRRTGKRAAR